MADPNLVIASAANLPSLDEMVGKMEYQPTPDVTAELMQVVRTIDMVATTSKNLKATYVKMLRYAALKVHAGLNVLVHRLQVEKGGDAGEVANLRRKTRSMWLEKDRMEKELEEASILRQEADRLAKDNMDLKKKIRGLEDDLLEMKDRVITEMDGGAGGPGGVTESSLRLARPPPLRLSFMAVEGRAWASPADGGGQVVSSPSVGSARGGLDPSLLRL